MKQEPELVRQNVLYSLCDYLSQPAMMILAAPVLLKALGTQQYGAWMLVNSIVATASGLGGGFGDSATKFISLYRGHDDHDGVVRSLVGSLIINCALSVVLATVLIIATPWLIAHVFHLETSLRHPVIVAVRIGAFLLLLRFSQAVFISSVRAFERYRPVVITTVASRFLIVGCAVVLVTRGLGLVEILWATLAVETVTLVALASVACSVLNVTSIRPVNLRMAARELSAFGFFTWLKCATGVLFSYADRLLVAALLGAGPLAFFVLCNQLTQPIPAILAAGFNFTFPHFSARYASGRWKECRDTYRTAMLISAAVVTVFGLFIIVLARNILTLWLGPAVAAECKTLLIVMTLGNGLLALSVVPQYAALALGRARALAGINIAAGAASLAAGFVLMRHIGLLGAGFTRLVAGLVSLLVFSAVRNAFQQRTDRPQAVTPELPPVTDLEPIHL